MDARYLVLRDDDNKPSHFAMARDDTNFEWLRKIYQDAAVYEQVPLKNPSAGKITLNKFGHYETYGFDMEVRANADDEDGAYIDSEFQTHQELKFLVSMDKIVILNNWMIPDGVIADGFLVSNNLYMGGFTYELVDNKYKVLSVDYIRNIRGIKGALEMLLNTVPLECCCN